MKLFVRNRVHSLQYICMACVCINTAKPWLYSAAMKLFVRKRVHSLQEIFYIMCCGSPKMSGSGGQLCKQGSGPYQKSVQKDMMRAAC